MDCVGAPMESITPPKKLKYGLIRESKNDQFGEL
jgi:hypothetical protein